MWNGNPCHSGSKTWLASRCIWWKCFSSGVCAGICERAVSCISDAIFCELFPGFPLSRRQICWSIFIQRPSSWYRRIYARKYRKSLQEPCSMRKTFRDLTALVHSRELWWPDSISHISSEFLTWKMSSTCAIWWYFCWGNVWKVFHYPARWKRGIPPCR